MHIGENVFFGNKNSISFEFSRLKIGISKKLNHWKIQNLVQKSGISGNVLGFQHALMLIQSELMDQNLILGPVCYDDKISLAWNEIGWEPCIISRITDATATRQLALDDRATESCSVHNYRGFGFGVRSISNQAFCTLLVAFQSCQMKRGATMLRAVVHVSLKLKGREFRWKPTEETYSI